MQVISIVCQQLLPTDRLLSSIVLPKSLSQWFVPFFLHLQQCVLVFETFQPVIVTAIVIMSLENAPISVLILTRHRSL